MVLDSKGKTGCIEVVFNGIESSNLRHQTLPINATTTTNSIETSPRPISERTISTNSPANEPVATSQLPTVATDVSATAASASNVTADHNDSNAAAVLVATSSNSTTINSSEIILYLSQGLLPG